MIFLDQKTMLFIVWDRYAKGLMQNDDFEYYKNL